MTVALTFTHEELGRMPTALREAMVQWSRTYQANEVWSETGAVPSQTGLHDIALQLLRVEAGLSSVATLKQYVTNFDQAVRSAMPLDPVRSPVDVVALTISLRRADLLSVVFENPIFRLGSAEHKDWVGHHAQQKDGGLALAVGHPTGYGLWAYFVMHHVVQTVGLPSASALLHANDPLTTWCQTALRPIRSVFPKNWETWLHLGAPFKTTIQASSPNDRWAGFRGAKNTNVLGLAVLMGDAATVQTLLLAGIPIEARFGAKQEFVDPLLLAGVNSEKACTLALLQHPTLDITHRFGRTPTQDALEHILIVNPHPWGPSVAAATFPSVTGLSLNAVLSHPTIGSDLEVYRPIKRRIDALSPSLRKRLFNGLTTASLIALERAPLLEAAEHVELAAETIHPRRRL